MQPDLTVWDMRTGASSWRTTRGFVRRGLALLLFALAALSCAEPVELEGQVFATVVNEFSDNHVLSVGAPTDLAFTPDGRMLITTQPGMLRVYRNGELLPTPALNIQNQLCFNSERGLLSVAVDPDYANNRHIYVFYTFKKHGGCPTSNVNTTPVNRVSRFTFNPDTNQVVSGSEKVLLDNILSLAGNHNGGDLAFGSDGLLYVTSGDSGCQIAGGPCAGGNRNG